MKTPSVQRKTPHLETWLVLGALLLTGTIAPPTHAAPEFLVETVQSSEAVGTYASMVLDATGTPHIAYFNETQNKLYYATKVGGAWVNEVVAGGPGFTAGEYCSIALDSADRPHIAFYFHGATYGNGPGLAIKNGATWSWEAVTQLGTTGKWISLALDASNVPHVSYYDEDNTALRYATKPASSWSIELVDNNGDAGLYTDIAVSSGGVVVVGYHETTAGEARYAHKAVGIWTLETVASGRGDTWGLHNSIAVDKHGTVHLAFYRYEDVGADYDAVYFYRTSSWQSSELIGNSATLGSSLSLALWGSNPHVTYLSLGSGDELRYAIREAAATWSETVVADSGTPAWPSLALDASNKPHVAFQATPGLDLKYAHIEWTDITPADLHAITNGTGVAWGDYDLDGLVDLYVGRFGDSNVLLQNVGGGDFADVTGGPEGDTGGSNGSAWGDFDNDEYLDLYVANNPESNRFLHNDTGILFDDWTLPPLDIGNGGFVVSWLDYDNDGLIDLYLSNLGQPNVLLRNVDGSLLFSDVTPVALALTNSQGVAWGDADDDGDQDLFVGTSNYNKLFRNDGAGVFVDVSGALIVSGSTRGAAWGDYDNDGDLDLYITQASSFYNKLFRNDGSFTFTDVTTMEIGDGYEGWDVAFLDYDNDADLDLFVANLGGDNKLLRNDGSDTWTDVTHGRLGDAGMARGAAWADIDNDGDLDLAVTDMVGPAFLVRNDVENDNHWLHVDLRGNESNRYGIGARISVTTGGLTQIREVTGGEGFNGQNSYTAEFGLGDATSVDFLQIDWPSGIVQTLSLVAVDQTLMIIEEEVILLQNAWTLRNSDDALLAADLPAGAATDETGPLPMVDSPVKLTQGPNGVVYGLGIDDGTPEFYTIDPDVPSVVPVDLEFPYFPAGVDPYVLGFACDPTDGKVYAMTFFIYMDVSFRHFVTINPETGWVKPIGETTYYGAIEPYQGFQCLAFSSSGQLYGIDTQIQSSFRIWEMNKLTNEAVYLASNNGGLEFVEDAAFLSDDFWVLLDQAAGSFARISVEYGSEGNVLEYATLSETPLSGLAQRLCTAADPELVVQDVPNDGGGQVLLDWSAYTPPPDLDHYEILRATDPCDLQPYFVAGPGQFEMLDDTAENYVAYYYGLRVVTTAAQAKGAAPDPRAQTNAVATTLVAGPVTAYPNLVINEFAPSGGVSGNPKRIGELVEIKNLSSVPIGLLGFRLSNGAGSPTPDEEFLPDVTIPAGGFHVHTLTVIDLPNSGGTLSLLPPSPAQFTLDIVGYGTQGGAPTVPAGFTVMRVDGTNENDPDDTSFESGTSTMGSSNNVPTPALGTSIQINEVVHTTLTADYVELYNPLGTVVNLSKFAISDGVNFLTTLSQLIQMQPGEMCVLDQALGTLPQSIGSPQLYLYKVLDTDVYQRIDQLGWENGPLPVAPDDALLRVPDGSAVYLGDASANWVECGGGTSLLYGPHSPGLPNDIPGMTTYVVDPVPGVGDYTTISAALTAASAGTRILVRPGTYDEVLALKSGVEIRGFCSTPDSVVIGGSGFAPAVGAVNVDASTKIAGVAIVGSNAGDGAAMHLNNSSPLVRNVHFKQNTASGQGGAVYVTGTSQPVFEGCLFDDNQATSQGGAVAVFSGSPTFRSCLFVDNSTSGGGGALYNVGGDVSVEHCVFDQNSAAGSGAGILHSVSDSIQVKYTTVTNSPDGSPLMAESGTQGYIRLECGDLYGHTEWFPPGAGVDTTQIVMTDPAYCDPTKLNYAYGDDSPLVPTPSACAELIGIAGPPCLQPTGIQTPASSPRLSRLLDPAPNPFNPATLLPFELERGGRVWLTIFDLRGRQVAELVNGRFLTEGPYRVPWHGRDHRGERVASGVYMAQLRLDGRVVGSTKKLVLLK